MSTILLSELSEKHYSRKIAGDVGEICEPLRGYGITHFLYSRLFFNDGSTYSLTNHWESYFHHCKMRYSVSPPVSEKIMSNKFFYLPGMTRDSGYNQASYDWINLFDIGQPIYFIECQPNYLDFFIYGSTPDNAALINFYLNNIDMLEKFKFYFKDKANKLIAKSIKNKILLPKEMCSGFNIKMNVDESVVNRQKFLKQLEVKNYIVPGQHCDISLSSRELDVIKELANGCTLKEAGKSLELSPRTVETHLNNLKSKLKLQRKTEIIKLISDLNLLRL